MPQGIQEAWHAEFPAVLDHTQGRAVVLWHGPICVDNHAAVLVARDQEWM